MSERFAVASGFFAVLLAACGGGAEELPPVPKFVEKTLPEVQLAANYDQRLEVTDGTPPYTFSVASGSLPDGLELKGATGQITGIAGAPGTFNFVAKVSDAKAQSAEKAFSIFVRPDPLIIVTRSLPSGRQGEAYTTTLMATGGIAPVGWTIQSGDLPDGLSLSAEGVLAGTPTEFGGFDFVVSATDSADGAVTQRLMLAISSQDPIIALPTIPRGRVGNVYALTMSATDGTPPYTWDIAAGDLPDGLTLAADGTVAGTPTLEGTFVSTVRVRDSEAREDTAELSIRVIAALALVTTSLPQAIAGRAYNTPLEATGGEPPYTWSLGGGTLPMGLVLDPEGRIVGTTSQVGESAITLRVQDAEGARRSALFNLVVTDRYVYGSEPNLPFPAVCTSTKVSYVTVPIQVPESMQVSDVDVHVELSYTGNNNNKLRLVLFSPDGAQAPLCGNGAEIPGGPDCPGQGGITKTYDDDGAQVDRPGRPLSVFDGRYARGTWRLYVGVARPTCNASGVIRSVQLTIRDERSPDPYVIVSGYNTNNLVTSPWVRMTGGGVDEHERFLSATVYEVGPNGYPEAGQGDDIALPTEMTWAWAGNPIPDVTLTPDGHVVASPRVGDGSITASGGGHSVTLRLMVLPPEWNPDTREY